LPYEHEHQTLYRRGSSWRRGGDTARDRRETDVERIIERCAGLDVHKSSVTACVRILDEDGALHQEIREFATTTRGLLVLRDWLASFEVRLVGMEATGVYWKPIYYMLEDDFELWLLNAHHLKNVLKAGRPTLRTLSGSAGSSSTALCAPASCRPRRSGSLKEPHPLPQGLRIEERTREVQRLDKVLQDAGIKLSLVATRVLGTSGRAMLDALVGGTTDPEVLAPFAPLFSERVFQHVQLLLAGAFPQPRERGP
jgi:transposase